MKTRKIKVVKRDAPKPKPTSVEKARPDPERGMTNAVKNWITERRKNSQAEKVSNDRNFARWRDLAEELGNPA